MQYIVCECFSMFGVAYEPAGTTPATPGALNFFDSGSASDIQIMALLKANLIKEDQTVDGIETEYKPPTCNLVKTVDGKAPNLECNVELTLVERLEGKGVNNDNPRFPVLADYMQGLNDHEGNSVVDSTTCIGQLPDPRISTTVIDITPGVNEVTTDDGNSSRFCTDPLKSLEEGPDGTWTATSQLGRTEQITTGNVTSLGNGQVLIEFPNGSSQTVAALDTDQVLAELQVVPDSAPGDGVATYHWEYVIRNLAGDEVNRIVGPTIQIPEIRDKNGNLLTAAVTILQPTDFGPASREALSTDELLARDGSGQCVSVRIPAAPDQSLVENAAGVVYPTNPATGNQVVDFSCCMSLEVCLDGQDNVLRIYDPNNNRTFHTDLDFNVLTGDFSAYVPASSKLPEPCDPGTEDVQNPADESLNCVIGATMADVSFEYLETMQEGWSAFPSASFTNPTLQALISGTSDFPIPAAPAGTVLVLQLQTGQEDGGPGEAEASQIGIPVLANPTVPANTGAPVKVFETSTNASVVNSIYAFDQVGPGSGGTLSISFPDADPATGNNGVIFGQWHVLRRVDGVALTASAAINVGAIASETGGGTPTPLDHVFSGFTTDPDCPSMAFVMGRHVSYEGTGSSLVFTTADNFAIDFPAGTELNDKSTMSGPHNFPGGNFCNIGAGSAFIPPGTTYQPAIRPNLGDTNADNQLALNAWSEQLQAVDIPVNCEFAADCNPNGALSNVSVPDSDCPNYRLTYSADVEAIVQAGHEVRLVPKINGVADMLGSIVYTSSTNAPFQYSYTTGSAMLDFQMCIEVITGDGVDTTINLTNAQLNFIGVE